MMDGGQGGIRTHEGLHPGGFQDRCHRPLGHLSDRRIMPQPAATGQAARPQSGASSG